MLNARDRTGRAARALAPLLVAALAAAWASAPARAALAARSPGPASPSATASGAAAASAARAAGDTLEDIASQATAAVVRIDVRTPSDTRQGSGFLVDSSGRIVTNYHVIEDARSIEVKLASGDVYDAVEILGTDERRDIAVLQVKGFHLPALPLGNSDSVRVGATVVLIGSPLGLENTVSMGIVSGRRQEPQGYQLLQVSAPASPGSSGGPVLSGSGKVVGIAVSQMQAGQNLNFAVPINYARGLLEHLGKEPVTILGPDTKTSAPARTRLPAGARRVNEGLAFSLAGFRGYTLEMDGRTGEGLRRRIRVSYRRIETVGGGEPRLERYLESETTERTGPFATPETVRRERSRTLVGASDLHPISTRGEVARRSSQGWKKSEYDLRFEDHHVRGMIRDTAGNASELDRDLPDGILLRGTANLAFATLASGDSLAGRSVEFTTFEPRTGDVTHDRYDVQDTTTVSVVGTSYRALRVNIASGLANTTAYFRASPPRILLRRENEQAREEVVHLETGGGAGQEEGGGGG